MPINANQNHGIDPQNADQCQPLLINADQFQSIPTLLSILFDLAIISIDRNRSTLGSMPEFWSALGIDLRSPVLYINHIEFTNDNILRISSEYI